MRVNLIAAALLLACGSATAQESDDYARMSRVSWAAFECAAFSSVLNEPKEQERLFRLGYDKGKEFLEALQAGRIKGEDLYSISPSGFLMLAQGPTPDFILGRVFESAQENALKDVITSETVLEDELKKSIASRKYQEGNCEVLGRGR